MIDQYEFCPELPVEMGLEKQINRNQGRCYYKVNALWAQNLIADLTSKNLLEKINYFGINGVNGFLDMNPNIRKIVEQYSSNCPKNFQIEINNHKNQSKVNVYCEWISDTCPSGFVRFSLSEGYLGCKKLASCEESGDSYYGIADEKKCTVCSAGGCLDYEMSHKLKVGAVCRINYKNPKKTFECPEYRVVKNNDEEGRLQRESFYRMSTLIKRHRYDEGGNLETVIEIESGWPVRGYDAQGRPKEEVIMSQYCDDKKCKDYLYVFQTRKKELIKEYVYSKEGKVSEEIMYKKGGEPIKRYRYDKNGKLKTFTDYKSRVPVKQYYMDGTPTEERIEKRSDQYGRKWEYVYNNKTGKVKKSRFYDFGGNVELRENDENGITTKMQKYDKEGILKEEVIWEDRESLIITRYDSDKKMINKERQFTNPKGKRVWVLQEYYADGSRKEWWEEKVFGNLKSITTRYAQDGKVIFRKQ